VREGEDVTLIGWGAMMPIVEAAAKEWEAKGVTCDVIDLRSLYPIDEETVVESVKKTGRVVIVHEAPKTAGLGAELTAIINEQAFLYLEAPVTRVTGYDCPVPLFALENDFLPTVERVSKAIGQVVSF
jgi:pyruvate dehydrogenase E1 component beta subunit